MTLGVQKDDISGSERREIVDCKRNPVSYLFFASRPFSFFFFFLLLLFTIWGETVDDG